MNENPRETSHRKRVLAKGHQYLGSRGRDARIAPWRAGSTRTRLEVGGKETKTRWYGTN